MRKTEALSQIPYSPGTGQCVEILNCSSGEEDVHPSHFVCGNQSHNLLGYVVGSAQTGPRH